MNSEPKVALPRTNEKQIPADAVRLNRIFTVGIAGTAIIALAGLLGYVPGLRVLGSLHPDYIPMAPSTSACFLTLSVVPFFRARKQWRRVGRTVLGTLVLLVTVFSLLDALGSFVGRDLSFEDSLFPDLGTLRGMPIGRMSPATGVALALSGLGVFLLQWRQRGTRKAQRLGHMASSLGILTALIGFTMLLGYLYGQPLMYGGTTIPMSPTTAIAFLFLSVAIVAAAGPGSFPIHYLFGNSTAAQLLRVFLPLTAAIVVSQSILPHLLPVSSVGNEALLLAVMVTIVGMVTMAVVIRVAHSTGNALDKMSGKMSEALEALRESEERFRDIAIHTQEWIWEIDTEGRYTYSNQTVEKVLGYSPEEILQKHFYELFHPDDLESLKASSLAAFATRQAFLSFVHHNVHKNGQTVWLETSGFPIFDKKGHWLGYRGVDTDITERKQQEEGRELIERLLSIANIPGDFRERMSALTASLQSYSRCEAVGIRLRVEEDYPYYETRGFPPRFVEMENQLCAYGPDGTLLRDGVGNPILECMCGNILCGRFDSAKPFFTARGSFYSNGTTALLASTTDADRQARTRNRCNGEGYESVALIALRSGDSIIGLLQFNDHHPNRFTSNLLSHLESVADSLANILSRRQAEEALSKSEERFRAIYERAPIGVALMDSASGRFLQVNPMYCEIVGYSQREMLTLDFMNITHPEDLQRDLYEMSRVGRGESNYYKIEKRYVRKNGSTAWVQLHVVPLTWEDGIMTEHLAIVSDITERKRAEKEKAKLEAQILQAQKMESVGRLAGGVAHDFNNMLGVIIGHSELALSQLNPDQPLYEDLTEIRNAAERSTSLTRQLLAYARKQTAAPRVLDLNQTVTSMLNMLQRLIGENINLNWHPAEILWPVKIDPSQLDQILANLVVNARDAITGVGKITIETKNCTLDEDYCAAHIGSVPGEYATLTVSDDGCGMDKETLAQIFEPFFTTKDIGKGTGLGLATVYGIVKQNNGFINAYSEPGHGTTFTIYLPRQEGKAGQAAETGGSAESLMRGHETILLVEDDPSLLKLTARMLEKQGYTVLVASTPGEALRLADEYGDKIHLLMTDVVMPEMNGRDLAKNLMGLYPNLKLLFMSGYTADVIAHNGVLDEGVHFIQKPFSAQSLATKLREVLDSV